MDGYKFAQLTKDILGSMCGVVVTEESGKIVYINEQALRELGRTEDECIGCDVEKIMPKAQMHLVFGEGEETVCRYLGKEGNEIIQFNRPIYRNGDRTAGEIVGAVGFLTEQTRLKRAEDLLLKGSAAEWKIRPPADSPRDVLDEILGRSRKVKEMKSMIRRIANTSVAVCILGETGTGKELVADAIHRLSERKDRLFVKINCAAIPKDLMESELFGYEPGAFTSASRRGKVGKFELADGGTLLLDEIGELPLNLQAKLLRVIQANEVERVGGVTPIPIDVRLICSTNRNLQQMVKAGIFRDDLYYRINVLEVAVPPLRERLEDIPLLIEHFISSANRKHKLSVVGVTAKAESMLQSYNWPGNIRELEHCIERACVLCGTGQLLPAHFSSLQIDMPAAEKQPEEKVEELSFRSQKHDAEAEIIMRTMEACRGNKTKAAEMLSITRATLYSKLKKYKLLDEAGR